MRTIILETPRLILRELTIEDAPSLAQVLSNEEAMRFYPHAFSLKEVENWIHWNLTNYVQDGFGLWAVLSKEDGTFLGDCGITMQDIEGSRHPELGYHILPSFQGLGYATEAAKACMEYAFDELGFSRLYTYAKRENAPSLRVAEKNGMQFIRNFEKHIMGELVIESLYGIGEGITC
ncbi:MAG: GNAT family N-acetyltransferase [Spirochaetales bacterium]|nr:GNAT family N-acetyltransferase [Spirochaetales bacterium]